MEYFFSGTIIAFIKLSLKGILETYFDVYPLTLYSVNLSNISKIIKAIKIYLIDRLLPMHMDIGGTTSSGGATGGDLQLNSNNKRPRSS